MSYRTNPVFRRPGFTLIEMLVVISFLVVLATLTVATGGALLVVRRRSQRIAA